jgi:hypothetical protein
MLAYTCNFICTYRPLPQWYDEAKVGIFMHFGVYSVPGDIYRNFHPTNNVVHLHIGICTLQTIFIGSMPFIIKFFNTQTILIKSIEYNSIAMFSQKPYIPAGFKPGTSVPESDAMSTAPRHQGVPYRQTM